ncbi:hypothetical protein EJ06DRAFT_355452 [Trichodelitschia bisporula]|uniref:Uncharacterized protein n=1 Tax=Trichodelitschia bisporula TaxID=703511 RepID=A0A6G1I053_9PEZI|nr:hypothetical protein EJ06DRAFT_355452 [Trichodelitschia bisporula]
MAFCSSFLTPPEMLRASHLPGGHSSLSPLPRWPWPSAVSQQTALLDHSLPCRPWIPGRWSSPPGPRSLPPPTPPCTQTIYHKYHHSTAPSCTLVGKKLTRGRLAGLRCAAPGPERLLLCTLPTPMSLSTAYHSTFSPPPKALTTSIAKKPWTRRQQDAKSQSPKRQVVRSALSPD